MKDDLTIEQLVGSSTHLSEVAKIQIENIRFTDEAMSQLRNEISISKTARSGYLKMLNGTLPKNDETDG